VLKLERRPSGQTKLRRKKFDVIDVSTRLPTRERLFQTFGLISGNGEPRLNAVRGDLRRAMPVDLTLSEPGGA